MALESESADSDPDKSPDEDTIYSALSDRRRRYTLHYLKQHGKQTVSVQDIAEQVAAWENNKSISEITSQERKRVYISLYQSHLSTMDDQGLVEYDKDAGEVIPTDAILDTDIYLEVVPRQSIPWSMFYVGLTIANAGLLVLAWANTPPFDRYSDLAIGAIVLITFGTSAFVQLYRNRQMRIGDEGKPPELED